jgi:hypothetical protein
MPPLPFTPKEYEDQLQDWVMGNSRHLGTKEDGECCPDGSCCNPAGLSTPFPARVAFAANYYAETVEPKQTFQQELVSLLNKHSKENGSNTPDWILADYLRVSLDAFELVTGLRDNWYGIKPEPAWDGKRYDHEGNEIPQKTS